MWIYNFKQFCITFLFVGICDQVSIQLGVECIATLARSTREEPCVLSLSNISMMRPPARRSLTQEEEILIHPIFGFHPSSCRLNPTPSPSLSVKVINWDQRSLMANLLASFCASKWTKVCQNSRDLLSLDSSNLASTALAIQNCL